APARAAGALLFGDLLAVGSEVRARIDVLIAVRVDLHGLDLALRVLSPAIGLSVEVGVLLELGGRVPLVVGGRAGLAVAVLVVELDAGLSGAVGDPAVLLPVLVGVLVLA